MVQFAECHCFGLWQLPFAAATAGTLFQCKQQSLLQPCSGFRAYCLVLRKAGCDSKAQFSLDFHVLHALRFVQLQHSAELSSSQQDASIMVQGKAIFAVQDQQLQESPAVKQGSSGLQSCLVFLKNPLPEVASFGWLDGESSSFNPPSEEQAPGEILQGTAEPDKWGLLSNLMRQQHLTAEQALTCAGRLNAGRCF